MASEIVSSDSPATPAQDAEFKRQPVTLDQIVEAWSKAERTATVGAITCGGLVHRFLVQALVDVTDRKERREARAVALREIGHRLQQAGYSAACFVVTRRPNGGRSDPTWPSRPRACGSGPPNSGLRLSK